MEPGESGWDEATGEHWFPDYLTEALSQSMSATWVFPKPKNIYCSLVTNVTTSIAYKSPLRGEMFEF